MFRRYLKDNMTIPRNNSSTTWYIRHFTLGDKLKDVIHLRNGDKP